MPRTGMMDLPLHGGAAPQWLVQRMKKLAEVISDVIISEYGQEELLLRLSNPDWFQAFCCVLAFDWHSSGTTTVLCGVLKSVLDPEDHGLAVVGGKGSRSRMAPQEISALGERFSFHSSKVDFLSRASRLTAKVDTALVQDGYDIYHHAMFISESGKWAVVQQGMDLRSKTARRYHWLSSGFQTFVEEPHSGIACDEKRDHVLDLTSRTSRPCRTRSLGLALDGRGQLFDDIARIRQGPQSSLLEWAGLEPPVARILPPRINWRAMNKIYDFKPRNYEELVLVKGVGASTVRALALVSDLMYGKGPSWEDPVKYSYCLGGKDGVPYPVDRPAYDESIEILHNAIKDAKLGDRQKIQAIRRLKEFIPAELQRGDRPWAA